MAKPPAKKRLKQRDDLPPPEKASGAKSNRPKPVVLVRTKRLEQSSRAVPYFTITIGL